MQETKQYFIALCGSRAEQALAQAQQQHPARLSHPSPVKAEGALHPAGPNAIDPASVATAGLCTGSPQGTDPAAPATAEPSVEHDGQEGLNEVLARLQSLLQHLPEAAEPADQEVPALRSGPTASKSDIAPAVDLLVGQTHRQTQSASLDSSQADQSEDMDEGTDEASNATAVAATPGSSPKQETEPAGLVAGKTATAVEGAATAAAGQAVTKSTVPVVCGSVQGTYDLRRGRFLVKGREATKPSKVEIMAGKGDGKTWAKTIQVNDGVAEIPLGQWLKEHRAMARHEARAKRRSSLHTKQQTLPAQHAKQGPSSAGILAGGVLQACVEARREAKAARAAARSPWQPARAPPDGPPRAYALIEDSIEYGTNHSLTAKKKSDRALGEWVYMKAAIASRAPSPHSPCKTLSPKLDTYVPMYQSAFLCWYVCRSFLQSLTATFLQCYPCETLSCTNLMCILLV